MGELGGAVWWDCVGELCVPGPPGGGSMGAEVHNLSAIQTPTGDHSILLFSVLYSAPVCVVTHLYMIS